MMNSATGDSRAVSRLIVEAAAMNSRALTATKRRACRAGITPAGISRPAVRGFSASMRRSAQRLKPMAVLRAKTMQSRTCTARVSHHAASCAPAFNPALAGRVVLLLSFPVQMTTWPAVGQLTAYTDATTAATPLAIMKGVINGAPGMSLSDLPGAFDLLIGNNGGCLGEVSALALLLGLFYMLWKKIITWHIPVSILVTVFVFSGIMYLVNPELYVSPVVQLLSGGLMLGAVFMATDYVTSPMSHKGMLIYGVCIGLLTVIIRLFGAYPEGMSFAILIMNAFTPLINTYVKPKRFGEVAKKK